MESALSSFHAEPFSGNGLSFKHNVPNARGTEVISAEPACVWQLQVEKRMRLEDECFHTYKDPKNIPRGSGTARPLPAELQMSAR